jgi:hypothetical protein
MDRWLARCWRRVESALLAVALKVGGWLAPHPRSVYPIFLVLLVLAVATPLLVNWLVRRSLTGQLLFALVVTTLALWALANARPVTWLLSKWKMPGLSIKRAALWSLFLLLAVPLAIGKGLLGAAVLLAGAGVAGALARLTRRRHRWTFAVGCGTAAVAIFVWVVSPRVPDEERPYVAGPRAVPVNLEQHELARRFRPILLFDERETRFPLDIEDAIAAERVRVCRDPCGDPVTNPREIDIGADFLAVEDITGVRGGAGGSAYYYRVHEPDNKGLMYVDYWWYYTRNPSPVAASIGCTPGLGWASLTCHEHPSDWEGITIVLGDCEAQVGPCVLHRNEAWMPVGVRYAQHGHVVSYAWRPTLETLWRGVEREPVTRPVVYVALDSHASYPFACAGDCEQHQTVLSVNLGEGDHDGGLWWRWNREDRERCEGCLKPLPLTRSGRPATWNAFPGRWGTQECILEGTYCDTTAAPESPSEQPRYQEPGRPGPWLCVVKLRPPGFEECNSPLPAEPNG